MTEINYTELNQKILEIIKREPINFSWVMSPVPDTRGTKVEYDYAYIEYPCGWFKRLYLEFTVVNPHAPIAQFVYVLTDAKLTSLFRDFQLPLREITNQAVLNFHLTEHASKVLEKQKQKAEGISLKFNRMLNKLISKIR